MLPQILLFVGPMIADYFWRTKIKQTEFFQKHKTLREMIDFVESLAFAVAGGASWKGALKGAKEAQKLFPKLYNYFTALGDFALAVYGGVQVPFEFADVIAVQKEVKEDEVLQGIYQIDKELQEIDKQLYEIRMGKAVVRELYKQHQQAVGEQKKGISFYTPPYVEIMTSEEGGE